MSENEKERRKTKADEVGKAATGLEIALDTAHTASNAYTHTYRHQQAVRPAHAPASSKSARRPGPEIDTIDTMATKTPKQAGEELWRRTDKIV